MSLTHIMIALFSFGFIVFFHELFHYLAAVAVGIRPKEFAVGFGKSILVYQRSKIFFFPKKNNPPYELDEISYHIKIFPLGGYVLFERPKEDEETGTYAESEYLKIHPLKRIFVSLAGPVGNFVLAFILLVFLFSPNISITNPGAITHVQEGSPAATIGLTKDDKIISINEQPINNITDISNYVAASDDICLAWTNAAGEYSECITTNGEPLGISLSVNLWEGIQHSFLTLLDLIQSYVRSFVDIILNLEVQQLNGPIGTLSVIQEAVPAWEEFVSVLVVVNIALGCINLLLPLSITDGGKIVIDLICLIRRKQQLNTNLLDLCSFGLLMCLFIFTFYLDITRIFQ